MSWIKSDQNLVVADADRGAVMDIWNALGDAINELKSDIQYLPDDVAAKRTQEIERLAQLLESGKSIVLGDSYRRASKEER
jgi:hypothetical protein